jgi:hypothetical protein
MAEYLRVPFDEQQIVAVKQRGLMEKSYAQRVGLVMALEMARRYEEREWYWPILDEIDQLEGLGRGSRTKPAEQFREGGPLYPLWHKHYFTPSHLIKNIGLRWSLDRKRNRDLLQLCQRSSPSNAIHELVIGGYSDRAAAGRLTGDWIVFAKHCGRNYYLGIATHQEGSEQGGSQLMDRLRKNCESEFPFCFEEGC